MIKTGAIVLGTVLLLSGSFGCVPQKGAEKEISYQDTAEILYDNNGGKARTSSMESVTINYTNRTSDLYSLAFRYPTYDYAPIAGSCAAIGGGNLIGFYDRYDENLIPNHKSGTAFGNTYLYSIQDEGVYAVIRELCDYMGTTTSGTTESQFKTGITNFCRDKGHSVTYTSCMQSGSFSYSKAQTYLKTNQPIVLFLSGYNVGEIAEKDNSDSVSYYVSDVAHIMIAFGYNAYIYDGTAYNYLSVASGNSDRISGIYNINYKTKINNALAVNIT